MSHLLCISWSSRPLLDLLLFLQIYRVTVDLSPSIGLWPLGGCSWLRMVAFWPRAHRWDVCILRNIQVNNCYTASMMKWVRGLKAVSGRSRGVNLVVAAIAISIILLSTQIYVYRLSRIGIDENYGILSDYILSIEQGTRHVAVASLINVSQGGSVSNFVYNLNRWESFVASDYKFGRCTLNSTLASESPYSGGIWLSWGTEGMGVSSASAVLTVDLGGRGVEVDWSFTENITTTMLVSGRWETVQKKLSE